MGLANLLDADIEATSCGVCGIAFGVHAPFLASRRADGQSFYCPNGHVVSFGDNELKRTKRDLERQIKRTEWANEDAKQQRARADKEERRGRSLRGHATRLRKRIAQGLCPCCSKKFKDVEAHIAAEHPRYQREPAG